MFRFSVRDILWLTLVAALLVTWWTDRRALERRHAREKNAILQEAADMVHEATNDFGR
jgi:hypothetical protein